TRGLALQHRVGGGSMSRWTFLVTARSTLEVTPSSASRLASQAAKTGEPAGLGSVIDQPSRCKESPCSMVMFDLVSGQWKAWTLEHFFGSRAELWPGVWFGAVKT